MTLLSFVPPSSAPAWRSLLLRLGTVLVAGVVSACGGSGDAPPLAEPGPAAVAPTITQQPASLSVTAGQAASFTVAATGTAPLSVRWQRNGADIAGATASTFTLASTAAGDSGAVFRAIATNSAGSTTSNNATLTVTAAAPVLTITEQPANSTVAAGTQAAFTVGGTCSSGTLSIQWQRLGASTFADVAGATAATYGFAAATLDTGAQFRANLACSGQSAGFSAVATLTVTAPGAITLGAVRINGLRTPAPIGVTSAIDRSADGSYLFFGGAYLWRLAADLQSITHVAGSGSFGNADGAAAAASFNSVRGMTRDAAGNLWITDNGLIRRVAPDGTVTTVAGTRGSSGSADGTGAAASFSGPGGIAIGPDGDLYVSDQNNNRVRRVTTTGIVTTYATGLLAPFGIAVAANNDVYVAEAQGQRVSRIVRSGSSAGVTQLVAGNGSANIVNPADGPGATAVLPGPTALFLRGTTLYVRDLAGLLRTIDTTTGVVGTFTGSRTLGPGYADGTPAQARLSAPAITGIADAPGGGLVMADAGPLRTIDAAGKVTTIANGFEPSTAAVFSLPSSTGVLAQLPFEFRGRGQTAVAVDPQGRIVVSEGNTHTVRRIDAAGNVTLLAGLPYSAGWVDGTGSVAQMRLNGAALAVAPSGVVYVPDGASVKRIDASGFAATFAGATGALASGAVDGPPATARFSFIAGLAVAPNGDLLVSDNGNTALRRIDAAGNVTTFSGRMGQRGTADGAAGTARYDAPIGLAYAPSGTLYLNDNGKLRRIAADGSVTTSTVVGVISLTVDTTGAVYVLKADGLYAVSATDAETLLMQVGSGVVYGNVAPTLGTGDGAMTMLGPKQLLIVSGRSLNVVSLP